MINNYAPCFNRIDLVVILCNKELPSSDKSLVKHINNQSNMLVSLNLQQIGLNTKKLYKNNSLSLNKQS